MTDKRIKNIVIVGGGTAGWMTAAAMTKLLNKDFNIRLIESDEISTVGVGEATIPQIKLFNNALGIDQNDFIKQTQGTFKLGIEFVNWGKIGDSYQHAFGDIGRNMGLIEFYHYWLRARQTADVPDLRAFSVELCGGKAKQVYARHRRRRLAAIAHRQCLSFRCRTIRKIFAAIQRGARRDQDRRQDRRHRAACP